MNNTLKRMALACALALLTTQGHAESLLQAYLDAKENDAQLKAQETGFLATLENKTQALAGKKPQISLSGNTGLNQTIEIQDANTGGSLTGSYTLGLSKSLYNKTLDARIDQVDASILQAKLQLENQRQALIMRVAQPYFDYLSAVEYLSFAATERKAVERQLEQVKVYFDVAAPDHRPQGSRIALQPDGRPGSGGPAGRHQCPGKPAGDDRQAV
ncbi:MAG: TolC family protein [Thiolinea sp.]